MGSSERRDVWGRDSVARELTGAARPVGARSQLCSGAPGQPRSQAEFVRGVNDDSETAGT